MQRIRSALLRLSVALAPVTRPIRSVFQRLAAIQEPIPTSWARALALCAAALVLWGYLDLSAHQHAVNPLDTTVPTLAQIWEKGVVKVFEATGRQQERMIVKDILVSGERLLIGFTLSVALSLVLGVLAGAFDAARAVLDPMFTVFSKTPAVAMYGLFFACFKSSEWFYCAFIMFAVVPTLAQAISYSVRAFPKELRYKLHTLGAGRVDFLVLMTRYSLPNMFDALKLQIGTAIGILIAAELIAAAAGFGYTIRIEGRLLNVSANLVYLAFLGFTGWVMYKVIDLQRWVMCRETRIRKES